jgi:hypothetical protein
VLGQVAPIINHIIKEEGINSVFGINFIEYFNSTFTTDVPNLVFNKFVVIYNVGYEKALKLNYSKQILLGLVQSCIDSGSNVIIQSNYELPFLRQEYGIDFQNVLKLPELPDEKIF